MSHFYASIPVSARRTEPTARGHASTGIQTVAASWAGAVRTTLYVDTQGRDCFRVTQEQHINGAGIQETIAEGVLGESLLSKAA